MHDEELAPENMEAENFCDQMSAECRTRKTSDMKMKV